MRVIVYLCLGILLLFFGYIVFRRIVRRDYQTRARLGPLASTMQLLVFVGVMAFPYLFNPPEWVWFWRGNESDAEAWFVIGFLLICAGLLVAFGTMLWFGTAKALGLSADGLTRGGPYKISRNPQIIGAYLLIFGIALQRPSIFSLGWIIMYAIIVHWMVITEEEYLSRLYGREYEQYCIEVPRYLLKR